MNITLISVPFDQDVFNVRCGKSPQLLKDAGLIERLEERGVHVRAETSVALDLGDGDQLQRLGRLGRSLADLVFEARERDTLPVVLGGDCINAIGVNAGLRRTLGESEFGVAWFDAHGDFNTPATTLSGYLGGMPLAASCGRGLDDLRESIGLTRPLNEEYIVMLGIRDLDAPEKELLDSTPISYLSPAEVAVGRTSTAAQFHFQNVQGFSLHFDLDALDPRQAPGLAYPTPEGMSIESTLGAMKALRQVAPLLAFTFSAMEPDKDIEGRTLETSLFVLTEMLAMV